MIVERKNKGTVLIETNLKIFVWLGGMIIQKQEVHNTWSTDGLNVIRDFLAGEDPTHITHIAWIDDGDVERDRDVVTQYDTSSDGILVIRQYLPSTTGANGYTISKIAAYDAATGGTMFASASFSSPVAKTASIQITAEWTHTFADDGA